MSASYNELLLTDIDRARMLLGDTDVNDDEELALLTNEHIDAVIAANGFALGVALLAEELIARFGQEPVKISLTGIAVDFSARIPAWAALALRMRAAAGAAYDAQMGAGSASVPTTGGW